MNDDDEIDLDSLAQTIFPGPNAQHRESMAALQRIELSLDLILKKERIIMAIQDDLRKAFADYKAKVDAYIAASEAHQVTVTDAVASALAADAAGDDAALADLAATITASVATVPDVPPAPAPVLDPPSA